MKKGKGGGAHARAPQRIACGDGDARVVGPRVSGTERGPASGGCAQGILRPDLRGVWGQALMAIGGSSRRYLALLAHEEARRGASGPWWCVWACWIDARS